MDDTRSQLEINKYKKFKKVDGATYRKVNQFLRKRTYITAREWALARLCTDFRTSGGAEMTFIGQHLPELVPFMEDTYSPQAVNQARNSFKKKVRKASSTFFYGAMCGFFTTDELDDLLFEASEVARFLLEVEGTTLDIDEEIDIEDRITQVMRGVGEAAKTILKARGEDIDLPNDALTDATTPIENLKNTHPEEQTSVSSGDSSLPDAGVNQNMADMDPGQARSEELVIEESLNSVTPPEVPDAHQGLEDSNPPITNQEQILKNTPDCHHSEDRQFRIVPGQPQLSDDDGDRGAFP
jgi:hypothetical protein